MSNADEWISATAGLGLALSLGWKKPHHSRFDRRPRPKPIQIHQLSRHSFTALVDVPLAERFIRVRGTTFKQVRARARWLRANYWNLRLASASNHTASRAE
jgi:hypothetical protein